MKHLIYILGIAVLATGCAYTPHNANIEIDQPAATAKIDSHGTIIHLKVVDDRDDIDLGRRGAGIAVAKVKAEGLMRQFVTAVEDGFRAKGYTLTNDKANANAELLVALRTLKFEESAGLFTVGAQADATIMAEAERGDEDYRKRYRASDEDRQIAISFGEGIDAQINQVLNEVLVKLFNDRQLDEFLTSH